MRTGDFQSSCFYHVIYMITRFYTVASCRFSTMVYLGLVRRLGLVGGHGLVKTSWSCQMSWSCFLGVQ